LDKTGFIMARRVRDKDIETREARGKLKQSGKPYWRSIGKGLHVGYRKNQRGGVWVVRRYLDQQKAYEVKTVAAADDVEDANGVGILDFWQAQEAARNMRPGAAANVTGYTVKKAVADYLEHLEGRASYHDAKKRLEAFVLPKFGSKTVNSLDEDEIRKWHRGIAKQGARARTKAGAPQNYRNSEGDPEAYRKRQASANRCLDLLKAVLNRSRKNHKRTGVKSSEAWASVESFRGVHVARTRYLTLAECTRLINACEPEFRVLVRAALETGARYQELARLRVADFNRDSGTLHVRKSKANKDRHIVLTDDGREFFASLVVGCKGSDAMLRREWKPSQQDPLIKAASKRARIDPPISFHALAPHVGEPVPSWTGAAVAGGRQESRPLRHAHGGEALRAPCAELCGRCNSRLSAALRYQRALQCEGAVMVRSAQDEATIREIMGFLSDVSATERFTRREVAVATLATAALGEKKLDQQQVVELMRRALHPDRGRGGDTFNNLARDVAIVMSVNLASTRLGLSDTRSDATRQKGGRESACSIVAEACCRLGMNLSEDAINKIWGKRERLRVGN
jgi:integrase